MLRGNCLVLSFLISVVQSTITTTSPAVTLSNGTYFGVHSEEYGQDYFLGLPYAQPPVGDLRFRNPVAFSDSWDDARPATQYSSEVSTHWH